MIFFSLLAIAFGLGFYSNGIIYNPSDSMPKGFYRRYDRAPKQGDIVLFEPPQTEWGEKRDISKRILKKVVAMAGAHVRIDETGITIHGILLHKSQPMDFIPPASVDKVLENGEVIVYSDYNLYSYDSRYFGIVNTAQIKAVVEPLFTYGEPDESPIQPQKKGLEADE